MGEIGKEWAKAQLGIPCKLPCVHPNGARWVVYYWEYAYFAERKEDAQDFLDNLPYHQREDATLEYIR